MIESEKEEDEGVGIRITVGFSKSSEQTVSAETDGRHFWELR